MSRSGFKAENPYSGVFEGAESIAEVSFEIQYFLRVENRDWG